MYIIFAQKSFTDKSTAAISKACETTQIVDKIRVAKKYGTPFSENRFDVNLISNNNIIVKVKDTQRYGTNTYCIVSPTDKYLSLLHLFSQIILSKSTITKINS